MYLFFPIPIPATPAEPAVCDYPDISDVRDDVAYADGDLVGELVVSSAPTEPRDILNRILVFIGTEQLSDDEWSALTIDENSTAQESYAALLGVLQSREAVSTLTDQLSYYFQAKGVLLTTEEPIEDLTSDFVVGVVLDDAIAETDDDSNIFVGGALE